MRGVVFHRGLLVLCLCAPVVLVVYFSIAPQRHKFRHSPDVMVRKFAKKTSARKDVIFPTSSKNKRYKVDAGVQGSGQYNLTVTTDAAAQKLCDMECQRFKRFMASWYDSPDNQEKPKAVIYILTQGRRTLLQCIKSIDNYFNNQFKYPVIIFHEKNLIPPIEKIKQFSKSNLFFQQVEFRIPDFLKSEDIVENIPCRSKISYRHMCRFQARGVYEQPIMADLDYHWRLDDDSLLLRPIKYDVFKMMKDEGYMYGYVWKHWDSLLCTTGLWEATSRFIKERDIKPTFFDNWPVARLFYNNFEISAAPFWFSKQYQRFIDFIDKLGGIYYFRWGDAPIKGLALSLFVPLNETYYFKDIGYRHGSFVLNNTIEA